MQSIFALLDLDRKQVVLYYPGGNEEYELLNVASLTKQSSARESVYGPAFKKIDSCKGSGNYSINSEDFTLHESREKGAYKVDR